jgi:hypothetical protein
MPPKLNRAPTIKDFGKATNEVFKDLRELKRKGLTFPEVLVHFKVQNGRLVRRKPKKGSWHEDDGILRGRAGEPTEQGDREGPGTGGWKG